MKRGSQELPCSQAAALKSSLLRTQPTASKVGSSDASLSDRLHRRHRLLASVFGLPEGWNRKADGMGKTPERAWFPRSGYCGRGSYHPHAHYIVAGGGLDEEGRWKSSADQFLVHVRPLGVIFRAKVRDEFKKAGLYTQVDHRVWKKEWVVHSEPVGSGEQAFKYLAPYIFRVAISNNRILKLEDGQVTFKYKESATDQIRLSTVTAEEFIRRFLQHVLPKGFVKVRYYGLLSSSNRHLLNKVRDLLRARATQRRPAGGNQDAQQDGEVRRCPECGAELIIVRRLGRKGREPP